MRIAGITVDRYTALKLEGCGAVCAGGRFVGSLGDINGRPAARDGESRLQICERIGPRRTLCRSRCRDIQLVYLRLLGRHIRRGADELVEFGKQRLLCQSLVDRLGDAEVYDLGHRPIGNFAQSCFLAFGHASWR